jgi:hypothetical protein
MANKGGNGKKEGKNGRKEEKQEEEKEELKKEENGGKEGGGTKRMSEMEEMNGAKDGIMKMRMKKAEEKKAIMVTIVKAPPNNRHNQTIANGKRARRRRQPMDQLSKRPLLIQASSFQIRIKVVYISYYRYFPIPAR